MPSVDTAPFTTVDALVVGGGPVGLLTALQLSKMGCTALLVDQEDKPNAPIYGRACTLWPRTLELLDQLGLGDALLEQGVVSRHGLNFRDGKLAEGGLVFGMDMYKHGSTSFKFALHLRQRLIERIIEKGVDKAGGKRLYEHKLESWADAEDGSEYPMICFVRDVVADEVLQIRCKYLVACDGGKSGIRKQAGVDFIGERSGAEWIRMDAVVKTDMPNPRLLNSVQSAIHGLVLFCPIDNGRTRIGYVFNEALQKKYGGSPITQEVAMQEAKKALAPFTLEFEAVDWVTLYGIGQCIASRFVSGRVLLAGDACHTHSSGSAQGLNTGAFDATNLAWKLAMVIKGHAGPALLDSYDAERRALVQQVIDNDKTIATLISGKLPPKFAGRTESPRDLLTEWFNNADNVAFTIGTGIAYPTSNYINLPSPLPIASILPGQRIPDVPLARPGTLQPLPLHLLLPNTGAFHLLVFAGLPHLTAPSLADLSSHLAGPSSFLRQFPAELFRFVTVVAGEGVGAAEYLGVEPWGRVAFDPARAGHEAFGVDSARGGIVVCRPDGYVGTVVGLGEAERLADYFGRFLVRKAAKVV